MYRHGGEDISGYDIRYDFSVNTNPLGPPSNLYSALENMSEIEHYPKACDYEKLCEEILRHEREVLGIDPGIDKDSILLGNGASEIIFSLIMMLSPKSVVICAPCFYGYERASVAAGADVVFSSCKEMAKNIDSLNPDLVCICNPISPTGVLLDEGVITEIADACERTKTHFLLDETFLEFANDYADRTFVLKFEKYSYLTVIRAFTKIYAMPGVRLGYAYISNVLKSLNPKDYFCEWNVSSVALKLGMEALLSGKEYIEKTREFVGNEKLFLMSELFKLGITEITGDVNYLFFRCDREIFDGLLKRNILIRKCDNFRGICSEGYYRIGVKDRKKNVALIEALREILEGDDET